MLITIFPGIYLLGIPDPVPSAASLTVRLLK
jgi:hypothetical protein